MQYYSLNNHLSNLKSFGYNHLQINSVGAGEIITADLDQKLKYPLMWIQFLSASPQTNQIIWKFRFIFCDVSRDKNVGDEQNIQSDLTQCAIDLISFFKNGAFRDIYTFVENSEIFPFIDKRQNVQTGVYIDITYKTKYDYSACNLPMDGFILVTGTTNDNVIVVSRPDIYTTSATLSGDTAIFFRNDGNNYTLDLSQFAGGQTFIRRHDFTGDTITSTSYCGTAPDGSLENQPLWYITKIDIPLSGSGTISLSASGVTWTGRYTHIYT
jgi:hypothetical protein